jgi:hypothetical protein
MRGVSLRSALCAVVNVKVTAVSVCGGEVRAVCTVPESLGTGSVRYVLARATCVQVRGTCASHAERYVSAWMLLLV